MSSQTGLTQAILANKIFFAVIFAKHLPEKSFDKTYQFIWPNACNNYIINDLTPGAQLERTDVLSIKTATSDQV